MPELTPFEERMLAGLRQVEPPRKRRRWLPVAATAAVAAGLLVLTVIRPPIGTPTDVHEASAPPSIRHLRWTTPHLSPNGPGSDEVWIDDVRHTVRLKSPTFDRTFTDVPEPIALNRPGVPEEFAKMSPDVLVADQRTIVADLPTTETALSDVISEVAKRTKMYNGQVLADLLSKPGLSEQMRAVTVKLLLRQPEVGLLDPNSVDLDGRQGALYVANVGPLSLQLVIDASTSTLLSMNKDTIVNQ
ncbi:hypothetical protein [Kutzneria sp. CA-103260]|uniref:hypothetical protein n=1 Tax=Kutzneria sp. CA-103260 TaxID=2802641 RepID=UPI001BA916D2|nr:hypothetical protein [Kutzneria sp. CA-103260]QUQ66919.1 hypothetical protein JJ691_46470 [Kutzneria sp. CA-103260]